MLWILPASTVVEDDPVWVCGLALTHRGSTLQCANQGTFRRNGFPNLNVDLFWTGAVWYDPW